MRKFLLCCLLVASAAISSADNAVVQEKGYKNVKTLIEQLSDVRGAPNLKWFPFGPLPAGQSDNRAVTTKPKATTKKPTTTKTTTKKPTTTKTTTKKAPTTTKFITTPPRRTTFNPFCNSTNCDRPGDDFLKRQ